MWLFDLYVCCSSINICLPGIGCDRFSRLVQDLIGSRGAQVRNKFEEYPPVSGAVISLLRDVRHVTVHPPLITVYVCNFSDV